MTGVILELVMEATVSKSRFKARALEYFREVERTGRPLVVTDHGRPVIRISAYRPDPDAALRELRESVVRYEAPTEPVGAEDWESAG
jgi:prevent-host-death family protein